MTGTTLLTTLVGMLLDGVNHVAILTNDTERLVRFYQEVFEATVSAEMPAGEGRRLTFIDISPSADLNVFEAQDNTEAQRQTPMFGRGRIDHLGLQAASLDAFNTIRDRLIERGATDGFVTDFGRILSLFFREIPMVSRVRCACPTRTPCRESSTHRERRRWATPWSIHPRVSSVAVPRMSCSGSPSATTRRC